MPLELGRILVAGKERDQRHPFVQRRIDRVGLEDELPGRHAADAFEWGRGDCACGSRTPAQNTRSYVCIACGSSSRHRHASVLDLAVEVFMREPLEAVEIAVAPIAGVLHAEHAAGAAPLELEREEAVPRRRCRARSCRLSFCEDLQQAQPAAKAPEGAGPVVMPSKLERRIEAAAQLLQALPAAPLDRT